jgi:hypothetical protein
MEATVTIDLGGGAASTNLVQLLVQHAAFALAPNQGVACDIASGVTNVSISPGAISIATASGATFSGTLTLLLQWTGQDPAVILNNLVPTHGNPATIAWPAASGPETQILTPGTPLTLSGISGT